MRRLYSRRVRSENKAVKSHQLWLLVVAMLLGLPARVLAAGSGLNVVVVVNQNSASSVELGNYYCEKRQIPPQNLLRVNWVGGNVEWTRSDFETTILNPLLGMISARQLTNQIDYVVLSMDLPYRVTDANGANTTTSVLFYGFKADDPAPGPGLPDSCSLPAASTSAYAGTEVPFRSMAPGTSASSFLAVMLTSSNLTQAKLIVDRAVGSDATFPTETVYLSKSDDPFRNIRYTLFDNTIFNTRLRGNYSTARTNSIGFTSPAFIPIPMMLGYADGLYRFTIIPNAFVPGGMADSLTSFGGKILEPNDHTTLLSFLNAGAIGSYGTVVEPCGYLEKFPSPQNYFYQSRGFSVAECYYQSITNPYQGIVVGEPLAAPFAHVASGSWNNLPVNALLVGTTNLSLQLTAADAKHPLQQVDLFLDGRFLQTITNIAPRQNNILYVTLPGRTNMSYTVPAGATLKSVTTGLTSVLNSAPNKNLTSVNAFAHGDRIELQSFNPNRTGDETFIGVSNYIGSAAALTTFIHSARSNFLDSIAWGIRQFTIGGTMVIGDFLNLSATKTNGAQLTVGVTNTSGSTTLQQFIQQFMSAINSNVDLQGNDGLAAEDLTQATVVSWNFNLRARGEGFDAAQIQALVIGSFDIMPVGIQKLDENLADLQPRNHLYITAGATNLNFTFPFNTTSVADGFHELTAVAYEGSHVRTQKRISQNVRIQNTSLSATFNTLVGSSNTAVETTLQFSVIANTNTISRIDLFSTGGLIGSVANQSNATFSVVGNSLGIGLHPFYAVVTRTDGKQYRTETKWIRLITGEPPFPLSIAAPPITISWPASVGRSYDILCATNVLGPYLLQDTVVASNAVAQWAETNANGAQRFYRVRVSP
jgi:uncharacterized protein (TIGR03790 family)